MNQYEIRNLKDLLRSQIAGDFNILDQQTKIFTAPGENYGSIMLGLDVQIKTSATVETLHLVAKKLPLSEMLKQAFDSGVTFRKEALAYLKAIPAFMKLQKDYNIPQNKVIDVFPKCFGARFSLQENATEFDEDGIIILENLKVLGYDTCDRLIGFNFEQAKLIVSDLAGFHAVGKAFRILKPQVFESQVTPCLEKDKSLGMLSAEVYKAMRKSVLEKAGEISEFSPYMERLERAVNYGELELKRERKASDELWATMVHGDYWVNNIMLLKNAAGNFYKNKIVDLQFIRYDSPIRDLLFLAFSSFQEEVIRDKLDDLIRMYFEKFTDVLRDFKIDLERYSWDAFMKELKTEAFKEFYHVAFMFKFICTRKGVTSSLDDFDPNEWTRMDLLGPEHKEKLYVAISEFVKRAWV